MNLPNNNNDDIDRGVLLRKASIWRASVLVIFIILVVVLGVADFSVLHKKLGGTPDISVARVSIRGEIAGYNKKLEETLLSLASDNAYNSVILHIDSGGGSAYGSERLFNILRQVADIKPMVTVVGSMAASGGYMLSCAGHYIVAHNSSIVGSVGAIINVVNVREALAKFGVKIDVFKSGKFKDVLSNTIDKDGGDSNGRELVHRTVDGIGNYFLSVVSSRRKINKDSFDKISDAGIFISKDAKELGLIDEIGSEQHAKIWLKDQGIDVSVVKDISITPDKSRSIILDMFESKLMNFVSDLFI